MSLLTGVTLWNCHPLELLLSGVVALWGRHPPPGVIALWSRHSLESSRYGVFTLWSFTLWSLYSPRIAALVSPHSMESSLYGAFTLWSLHAMKSPDSTLWSLTPGSCHSLESSLFGVFTL